MQHQMNMGDRGWADLQRAVDSLPSDKARRVARLVLECRASLADALRAVQLADDPRFLREALRGPDEPPRRAPWWWPIGARRR